MHGQKPHLKQLLVIFNMSVPPPDQQLIRTITATVRKVVQEHTHPTPNTEPPQEYYPALTLRVVTPYPVTLNPLQVYKPPPQQAPHIIPDDTKPIPLSSDHYDGSYTMLPPVHKYNIRSHYLQFNNLITNHVDINIPHPTASRKVSTTVLPAGEY